MEVFFAIAFVIIILPTLTWSRRSLFWTVLIVATPVVYLLADHSLHRKNPSFDPGLFASMGVYLTWVTLAGFCVTAAARALGLYFQSRGKSRRWALLCDAAGLAVIASVILVAFVREEMKRRNWLPVNCPVSTFQVDMKGQVLQVPLIRGVILHLGHLQGGVEQQYFFLSANRAHACEQAQLGRSLPASKVTISTRGRKRLTEAACEQLSEAWQEVLCDPVETYMSISVRDHDPQGVGARALTQEAFEASRKAAPWKSEAWISQAGGRVRRFADEYLILDERHAAGCRPFGARMHCTVTAEMQGVIVHYKFRADISGAGEMFIAERERAVAILKLMTIPE